MSELVSFGVECGNAECGTGIILGDMRVRPKWAGDRITFVTMKPTRIKCEACGFEKEYTQSDLREFPYLEGEAGQINE